MRDYDVAASATEFEIHVDVQHADAGADVGRTIIGSKEPIHTLTKDAVASLIRQGIREGIGILRRAHTDLVGDVEKVVGYADSMAPFVRAQAIGAYGDLSILEAEEAEEAEEAGL